MGFIFGKRKQKKQNLINEETMMEQGIPKKVMDEVEAEIEEIFKGQPRGMGFCHVYWNCKKELLKRRGYGWQSPRDLNPDVIYD